MQIVLFKENSIEEIQEICKCFEKDYFSYVFDSNNPEIH